MTMKRRFTTAALGLATIFLCSFPEPREAAAAMAIDPQCEQMNDKIGCTCALKFGGRVYSWHGMMKWNYGKAHVDEVETCKRAGG